MAYCDKFSSVRTHEWYLGYITNFLKHLGKAAEEPATSLKPIQVDEWVHNQKDWGPTYIRGAITALQAAYNWAVERNHISESPIKNMEKPKAAKRNNPMPISTFKKILSQAEEGDSFRDVLILIWNSDCRPEEIRHLEADFIDLDKKCIRIPAGVSRAGQKPRIIYLNDEACEVLSKLIIKNPSGKLFLNSRGVPWTKFALCNRLHRYSRAIGKAYALSDCRNGVLSTAKIAA